MRVNLRWVAVRAGTALALVASVPTAIESSRWWHSPRVTATLQLSRSQIAAIDEIYWRMLPERTARAADANAAAARLDRLLPADIDEADLMTAATEAANAAAARSRLRTLLLFRIGRVLTPQQRDECDALGLRSARD